MPSERDSLFNDLALSYDKWYETPFGQLVDRLEKEAVFSLLDAKPGALALDLSCGTGNYALALAQQGLRVVGVDFSEPMLRVAGVKAARAEIALYLVQADGHALPFRDRAFDLVTLILGLEFAVDPGKILQEAHRILKPDTDLVVAVLNRASLWNLWRRVKRHFVPSVWRRASFLSFDELRGLLEAHGFRDLRWRGAVRFLPLFRTRWVRYLERWESLRAGTRAAGATFLVVRGRRGAG
jgi:ubiquinone/menaquinone biosynthesis C-methylase UbiE